MGNLGSAANTFSHIIAGELNVDSTWMGAEFLMYLEEASDFIEDIIEFPSFVAARRFIGISMHRIADPENFSSRICDRFDQWWK